MCVKDVEKGRRGQKAVRVNGVEGRLSFIGNGALDLKRLAIICGGQGIGTLLPDIVPYINFGLGGKVEKDICQIGNEKG